MTDRVRYTHDDGIGWIDLDDGKVNVMSPTMQTAVGAAFDQAKRDDVVVVVRGRPSVFSAGFDLNVLGAGGRASADMVLGGFKLAHRILGHPRPVLMACTGHAVAMGVFLLMAGDYRIGIRSPAKLTANEVAIGLTLPHAATELLRQRMTPSAFQRAALLAESFDPDEAVAVGILDETAPEEGFESRVADIAAMLTSLDLEAQRATKQRTREPLLASLSSAIARDEADYERRLQSSTHEQA